MCQRKINFWCVPGVSQYPKLYIARAELFMFGLLIDAFKVSQVEQWLLHSSKIILYSNRRCATESHPPTPYK